MADAVHKTLAVRLREQYDQLVAAGDAVPKEMLWEVLSWVTEAEAYERTLTEGQQSREVLRLKYVAAKEERNFFQAEVFKAQKALKELAESIAVIPPKEGK